ncbi:FAD:protein FMN transferase [uncultured Jatrophihabitans sp.]|uniref:FAD:protein FMN transferase n=1 Tax=uncultured Jatrophihabitans sp. TaxID=1610747 RepID=UPI0035CB6CF6
MTAGSPTDIRFPRAAARVDTPPPLRQVEKCMGTVFSFQVATPGLTRGALLPVLAWLHDMDALFSTYRPDSRISRINAGALRVADADDEVRHVLAECERYRELTDGYFDARAGGRLDPSGYVKGWAIRTASDMLSAAGSTDHCVNGGGDVACVGRPAPDRPWRIGIADPHRPGDTVRTVTGDGPIAVATSGLAERAAHIVDPHTHRPVTELASVTVVAADLVTADVYATAAVAMGAERGVDWLGRQPDMLATLVTAAGAVVDVPPRRTATTDKLVDAG